MFEKAALKDFEVVELDRVRGDAVMTVTSTCVRFNKATARELGFPDYARALIHEPTKRLAIEACEMNDKSAFAFVRDEAGRNEDVLLKVPALLMTIKRLAGFEEEGDALSCRGVLYPEDHVILFELAGDRVTDEKESRCAENVVQTEKADGENAPVAIRETGAAEGTGMPAVQKGHRGRPRKVARPVALNPLRAVQGETAVSAEAAEGGI